MQGDIVVDVEAVLLFVPVDRLVHVTEITDKNSTRISQVFNNTLLFAIQHL